MIGRLARAAIAVTALVSTLAALACGTACGAGESRCSDDATYEICNSDRSGWSPAPCHVGIYPGSRCVTLDDKTAVCSITGAPLPLCSGSRATACASGALVQCYRGHGAPTWQACEGSACIDGPAESMCGVAADAGHDGRRLRARHQAVRRGSTGCRQRGQSPSSAPGRA